MDIRWFTARFLRGFNPELEKFEDERERAGGSYSPCFCKLCDFGPTWTLFSERAEQQQLERHSSWEERRPSTRPVSAALRVRTCRGVGLMCSIDY